MTRNNKIIYGCKRTIVVLLSMKTCKQVLDKDDYICPENYRLNAVTWSRKKYGYQVKLKNQMDIECAQSNKIPSFDRK